MSARRTADPLSDTLLFRSKFCCILIKTRDNLPGGFSRFAVWAIACGNDVFLDPLEKRCQRRQILEIFNVADDCFYRYQQRPAIWAMAEMMLVYICDFFVQWNISAITV